MNKIDAICEMLRYPMSVYVDKTNNHWRYNDDKMMFESSVGDNAWREKNILSADFISEYEKYHQEFNFTESFITAVHDMLEHPGTQYMDSEDETWEYDKSSCNFYLHPKDNGNRIPYNIYEWAHLGFRKVLSYEKRVKVKDHNGPYISFTLPAEFEKGMVVYCVVKTV